MDSVKRKEEVLGPGCFMSQNPFTEGFAWCPRSPFFCTIRRDPLIPGSKALVVVSGSVHGLGIGILRHGNQRVGVREVAAEYCPAHRVALHQLVLPHAHIPHLIKECKQNSVFNL